MSDAATPLVSVDVWDTVLRRRCHPDEVKLFTARWIFLNHHRELTEGVSSVWDVFDLRRACERQIGRQRAERGEDDEYRIDEVFTLLARRLLGDRDEDTIARLVAAWIELEYQHEARVSYPDPHVVHVLNGTDPRRLVLLSDFYMPARRLKRLVQQARPELADARVVVSCDEGFNKRSGRLFVRLEQMFDTPPQAHIHLGDNEDSDVRVPQRLGIRALRYDNPAEERRRAERERRFARRRWAFDDYWHELMIRLEDHARRTAPPARDRTSARLFAHGVHFAPLYWGFVLFAIEHALRVGVGRVYYFTREGETFCRLHQRLLEDNPLGGPLPEPHILEVSRLATFLPSLRELTPQELMRIWNLYSIQPMGALLRTLDLRVEDFRPLLARHGLDADTPVTYPWQHENVRRFLADPQVQRMVLEARDARRTLLLGYLSQRGLDASTPRALIVDIGWRGTIQDNLAWLLPQTQITGCYFGLLELLNEQPPNVTKHAFGPDANRDDPRAARLLDFVTPLEMLASPPAGSTVGYRPAGGRIVAVREENPAETAVYRRYVSHFHAGVESAGPVVLDWYRTCAVTTSEMRPHVIELLRELVCTPPRAIVRTYFRLVHNETFGVGRYVGRQHRLPWLDLVGGLVSRRWRQRCVQRIEQSTWPQGLLKLYYLDPLCHRYNRARDRQLAAGRD